MKFFAIFAALAAVAVAYPTAVPTQSTWTLQEIDAALQDPTTNPALIPALEHALNQIMDALYAGMQIDAVVVQMPVEPAIPVETAPVESVWTLQEITAALQDPNTEPALIPVLEHALNQIMDALHAGMQIDAVVVQMPVEITPTPVVVAPAEVAEIVPTPVQVVEGSPAAVEAAPAADASAPLVQIIINVNGQPSTISVPIPMPSPVPSPVVVPEIVPTPVTVVEEPIEVTPVQVVEPEVVPVQVVETAPVNPIDLIVINPPEFITNPILAGPAVEVGPM